MIQLSPIRLIYRSSAMSATSTVGHVATRLPRHSATSSLGHVATRPCRHSATSPLGHLIVRVPRHSVDTQPPRRSATSPLGHLVARPHRHSAPPSRSGASSSPLGQTGDGRGSSREDRRGDFKAPTKGYALDSSATLVGLPDLDYNNH